MKKYSIPHTLFAMNFKVYLLFVLFATLGISCEKEGTSLSVSEQELELSYEEGSLAVEVNSEVPWETSVESWKGVDEKGNEIENIYDLQEEISFSPVRGKAGTTTVLFRAAKNNTYHTRGMSVRIKAGAATADILFLQKPGPYLSVSPRSVQAGADGGQTRIIFMTSRGIQLKYKEDWIRFPLPSVSGELATEGTLTVLENASGLDRSGKVILETMEGQLYDTIFINQKAKIR